MPDEHDVQWCEVRDCPHPDCVAYDRYCTDMVLEHEPPPPMDVDRLSPFNRCNICDGPPTNDNPVTIVPGQPADLENGPSERDLPLMLHVYDCTP